MSDQIDYELIRQRVEKRIKDRQEFVGHLAAYISVNAGLWMIWFFTGAGDGGFPWPLFPTIFWGIGFLIHVVQFVVGTNIEQRREDMIEHEIRREKMRLYGDPDYDDRYQSKPKRYEEDDPALMLSDDGEIIADEISERRSNRRSRQV